jgi:hypothetical protein
LDDRDANRPVALHNRPVDVEADDPEIESVLVDMLGGTDGVQLRAPDSHVVDDEDEPDGLATIRVGALRVRHGGSVWMTVQSLALCIEFVHVDALSG